MKRFAIPMTLLAAAAMSAGASGQDMATLSIAESDEFGQYLVGPDGLPVYAFSTDTQGNGSDPAISCTGDCLDAWPPVTVDGEATVGDQLDQAMADSFDHDGQMVATYNGWPLYGFVRDEEGAAPAGHEVESFGGQWYLVSPEGEPVGAGQ